MFVWNGLYDSPATVTAKLTVGRDYSSSTRKPLKEKTALTTNKTEEERNKCHKMLCLHRALLPTGGRVSDRSSRTVLQYTQRLIQF
ncbi:hypothetical protein J6590_040106 [Homalodisca vitripennis]|nr:hypothetical protein J6590_040106 [Homalodisca vitripennis]